MELLYETKTVGGARMGIFTCPVCRKQFEKPFHGGQKAKSCQDCYFKSLKGSGNPRYSHGHATGGYTKLYMVWADMKRRASNPKHARAKDYVNRGIGVCKEWMYYSNFKEWAESSGYRVSLTLDRVDNDLGYSPENCRWISIKDNVRNSRTAKITVEKAKMVKAELRCGLMVKEVADKLSVSEFIVADIKRDRTWRDA